MHRLPLAACLLAALAAPALAQGIDPRPGWRIVATDAGYPDLLERLRAAIPEAGMALVTEAGPTEAAASRGIEIPGNRVLGVFNNEFAVATLGTSTAAMIEAPIRFYVTEDTDGSATLSWKEPSFVFEPYFETAGDELRAIAADLDAKFEEIAAAATAE